jgi:hypothetical protein
MSLVSSLRGYRRGWLRGDVLAGLTVWAVLVPEALAYATIAGVPPVVGLYAAPGGADPLRRVRQLQAPGDRADHYAMRKSGRSHSWAPSPIASGTRTYLRRGTVSIRPAASGSRRAQTRPSACFRTGRSPSPIDRGSGSRRRITRGRRRLKQREPDARWAGSDDVAQLWLFSHRRPPLDDLPPPQGADPSGEAATSLLGQMRPAGGPGARSVSIE